MAKSTREHEMLIIKKPQVSRSPGWMPGAETSFRPASGPPATAQLFVLTKLFVCLPYDPKLRAGSCGLFGPLVVSLQALACLYFPPVWPTSFRHKPQRVLSSTQHLGMAFHCSRVSHCLLLVLAQNSDVKWKKKNRYLGFNAKGKETESNQMCLANKSKWNWTPSKPQPHFLVFHCSFHRRDMGILNINRHLPNILWR